MIHRRTFIIVALVVAVVAGMALLLAGQLRDSPDSYPPGGSAKASFDKTQYSLSDPSSIWVVVNKARALNPLDYAPAKLTVPPLPLRLAHGNEETQVSTQIASALEDMAVDARENSLNLMLVSGYRSLSLQTTVYGAEVRANGQAEADKQSARPGHSEHQTGLAADIGTATRQCELEACFADLPEGKWLAANAYKYGFIIRYPKDKSSITGYAYEPWHIRYVGKDLAGEMHNKRITTLEEFFGLPAAPSYPN